MTPPKAPSTYALLGSLFGTAVPPGKGRPFQPGHGIRCRATSYYPVPLPKFLMDFPSDILNASDQQEDALTEGIAVACEPNLSQFLERLNWAFLVTREKKL